MLHHREVIRWYRVRKTWADSKTQKGAYEILDNAKKCVDQNPGYKVFDADGKVVYEPKSAEPAGIGRNPDVRRLFLFAKKRFNCYNKHDILLSC